MEVVGFGVSVVVEYCLFMPFRFTSPTLLSVREEGEKTRRGRDTGPCLSMEYIAEVAGCDTSAYSCATTMQILLNYDAVGWAASGLSSQCWLKLKLCIV